MKPKLPAYLTKPVNVDDSIRFLLQRPVYEPDNGATPWYTEDIGLGTPPEQKIRFMIDTGTKNTWVTSSLCTSDACKPHNKFNPGASTTYQNDGTPETISFGAWGSMTVTPSKDLILLPAKDPLEVEFDMSTNYTGQQFQELICDGGIAIPSHLPVVSPNSTEILNLLKQKDIIEYTVASFWYNQKTLKGEVIFGGVDLSKINTDTINVVNLINFPSDLECWLVNLDSMNGLFRDGSTQNILTNVAFALDTGSSQFKGDPKFIDAAKKVITNNGQYPEKIVAPASVKDYPYPVLELVMNGISYKLPPEKYFISVSETEWHLAFHFLADCENEFLVGTTFLESICTIFDFDNRCIVLAETKF